MTNTITKKAIKIDPNTRYRVSVSRSNKAISAQIIDDSKGFTIDSASSVKLKEKKTPSETAMIVGETLGKSAIEKGIIKICFDRGSYRYHGRVKSFAEGLRKAGLNF